VSLLEVRDLQVRYAGVVAVRDVSLSVDAGQVLAVLGANGAGKTSTLRAISGLVRASGTVLFDGQPLTGLAPEVVARQGIAHVPAGRGLFPTLSVADNLRMGLYGARSRDDGVVEEMLETFPILRERRDQAAGTMSGGQQQQLVIARALVQRPRLLMVDEMSMGLAPRVVAELFVLVAGLRDKGMAVVIVEQFVGQALAVADRAVVLEQGSVVSSGAPADLSTDDLTAAYLGGGGEGAAYAAPDHARERLAVSLRGADVRRLKERAAAQGRPVEELLGEIVRESL
jgi:branched-chain amino acid transport system ATP-binding protein